MNKKQLTLTALFTLMVLLFAGCKSEEPEIENLIKGHEEWGRVEAVMRMGFLSAEDQRIYVYDDAQNAQLPVVQTIEYGRSGGLTGSVEIKKGKEGFQVIKGKNIFYTLEMKYYNLQGQLMNYQFCLFPPEKELQMLPIHQHFFVVSNRDMRNNIVYPTTLSGDDIPQFHYKKENTTDTQTEMGPGDLKKITHKVFNYVYRDTDPDDQMIDSPFEGRKVDFIRKERSLNASTPYDRVGLKGYMQFFKADMAFQMHVELVHIIPGDKYIGAHQPGDFLNFDERFLGWSVTDLVVKMPIRVIADADGDENNYVKNLAKELKKDETSVKETVQKIKNKTMPIKTNFRI